MHYSTRLLPLALLGLGLWFMPSTAGADDKHRAGNLDTREVGYEHGYRDGYSHGLDAKEHGKNLNLKDIDADHDYHSSFGPKDAYKAGYREGYEEGAKDAYSGSRARLEEIFRYEDPKFDVDRPGEDRTVVIYRDRKWSYQDVANDVGYRDGINAGLKDFQEGKKFDPQRHDSFKDADHGYDKAFGPKDDYKRAYRAAYEAGYRAGYGLTGRG